MGIGIGAWLLFALSIGAPGFRNLEDYGARAAFPFAGMLMFGSAMLLLSRQRCPRCKATLGNLAVTLGIPFVKQPNFCPYCGVSFDEPWDKDAHGSVIS